jgi:Major Facilitator Superfamily
VFAARILLETRGRDGDRLPDLGGALILMAAIGALTLGIVKGPDWGWGAPVTIVVLGAAVLGLGGFVFRCARHPAPVIELALLRVRAFAWANIAGLFFFAAFGAMLLSSVLFLTRVWHEDVLTAGLQIAPGPAAAALFAPPAGLLAARFGQRALALPGLVVYAAGAVWWLTHMGLHLDYAGDYLPGMIIGGAGVGMVIPTLASATAAALPPDRFATGSAVYGMARQIGVALGVAILGHPAPAQVLDSFRHGWDLMLGATLLALAAATAIGRGASFSAASVAEPAPAGA